jgi:putative FmdB family regulatory protein
MPTYEYTCKLCGQTVEAVQSFSEKPLRKHAECGGELQKVFHARGVVFKGSGFYSTDSRSSKPATATSNGSKTESTSTKTESTTTKTGASTPSPASSSGSD